MNTTVYDGFSSETVASIIECIGAGLLAGHVCSTGTLVTPGRNNCVFQTYKNYPDFTHILMLDSDIVGFRPDMLGKLVERDVDIVAPVTVARTYPHAPHVPDDERDKFAEHYWGDKGLVEFSGLAMGCTLIKRKVLDQVCERFESSKTKQTICNWFADEREPRETIFNEAAVEIKDLQQEYRNANPKNAIRHAYEHGLKKGLTALAGGTYHGEDYFFCRKARKLGFKCYMDLDITLGHKGYVYYVPDHWDRKDKHAGPREQTNIEPRN